MAALENSPHKDNTIIVYTADHGLAMGSHGLLGKQNVYEQSMRCPLIIHGPGIPQGESSEAFTYVHDLYATLCGFAGVERPDGIDSLDLAPLMDGTMGRLHAYAFLPFQDNQRAINDGHWKLHVYPKINHTLLFDLKSDPHEINNLAGMIEHKAQLEEREKLIDRARILTGDRYPYAVAVPESKENNFDNSKRVLDVWQPKWIRDKYFDGREKSNHGRK